MDYISDQLTSKLIEVVKKKEKKSGMVIKPFQVGTTMDFFYLVDLCHWGEFIT